MNTYNPKEIESKWRQYWEDTNIYRVEDDASLPKYYVLDMFPYPSGAGLHVGHPKGYIATDIFSRFKKMSGYNVLHPMGWDAFGLPAENYAIKNKVHPRVAVEENIEVFKSQLAKIGFNFDWSREINTTDPEYYKWTQWCVAKMFEKGLMEEVYEPIIWCPGCQTGLALEDLDDGVCERCGSVVEKKPLRQWVIKITKFADRLLEDLDGLDWEDGIKEMQRNWIGRSEGAEIEFKIQNSLKGKKVVCLHAFKDNAKSVFWPWLIPQLEAAGAEVTILDLPNPAEPNIEEQVAYVQEHADFTENTIVITHSLGGVLAMKLLPTLDVSIEALYMIAPPLQPSLKDGEKRPSLESACDWSFDFDAIKEKTKHITVVADTNDHLVPEADTRTISEHLGATYIQTQGSTPHFNGTQESNLMSILIPKIEVFTTRPDTLFGVTYMVLAPEHPLVHELEKQITNIDEVKKYVTASASKTDIDREKEKTGVKLEGISVEHPVTGESIPVYIADYVLMGYGTGAIMAVPAHDERDFAFAKKYGIEIKEVVAKQLGDRLGEASVRNSSRAICVRDNKMLLTFDTIMNEYLLPGGGIENSETPAEAVLREFTEETGYINTHVVRGLGAVEHNYFHHYRKDNWRSTVHAFVVELVDEVVIDRAPKEIEKTKFMWLPISEAKEKLMNNARTFAREIEFIERYEKNSDICFSDYGVVINSDFLNGFTTEEAKSAMIDWLEKNKKGTRKVQYKLRDWVFARQRYWGEPFPFIHKADGTVEVVPDAELPVVLPEVEHYEPTGTGESPLSGIEEWVNVPGGKRETNTMPQWAGSSWYYLRYIDPKNSQKLVDSDKEKYWMGEKGVDLYVGGTEHATRHLIYARFWHKFLFDLGVVSTHEPFHKLINVGLIMAEDGRKMSKRWNNVINPDDVISEYGADSFRLYEMFIGPFTQSAAWNTRGVEGVHKFLQRYSRLYEKTLVDDVIEEQELLIHQTIKKVTEEIEKFQFNTAISQMMIAVNDLTKAEKISRSVLERLNRVLAPFAVHLTEEVHQTMFAGKTSVHLSEWPTYDESKLVSDTMNIAVQVNGKLRATIEVSVDMSEEEVKTFALAEENVIKWLEGNEPKKVIYVAGKIVSVVV